MKAGTSPERAGSLVIELAARTAVIDGKRVELPPTEFSLLAVLAARPGEVVPHKELLMEAFGDSAHMDRSDLHWRIWKIRELLGDQGREHMILANRRGVGYVIDLPPSAVEVVNGVLETAEETPEVIHLDDPAPQPTSAGPVASDHDEPDHEPETEARPRRLMALRPGTALAAVVIAAVALGGSWVAGYRLSQLSQPAAPDVPVTQNDDAPDPSAQGESNNKPDQKGGKKRRDPERGDDRSTGIASGSSGSAASGDAPVAATDQQPDDKSDGNNEKEKKPPPPLPQPDAQLYHLFNSDSGDHLMTTSSSVANQKQAEGYVASVEGKVFSKQEKGTRAISLDSGTAYVYSNSTSAPKGVSVTALYRLAKDGDLYYTTSSSQANQAQAQGWTRTTVGYVVP